MYGPRFLIRTIGGEIKNGAFFSDDVDYDYREYLDLERALAMARRTVQEVFDGEDAEVYVLSPKECDPLDGWVPLGGVAGKSYSYEYSVSIYKRERAED
jgi:hypothetical protein